MSNGGGWIITMKLLWIAWRGNCAGLKRRRCHYSRTNRQLSMVLRRRWGWWGGESMRPSRRIISLVTATAGNNILMSTFVHIKMLGYRYLHARNANRNLRQHEQRVKKKNNNIFIPTEIRFGRHFMFDIMVIFVRCHVVARLCRFEWTENRYTTLLCCGWWCWRCAVNWYWGSITDDLPRL